MVKLHLPENEWNRQKVERIPIVFSCKSCHKCERIGQRQINYLWYKIASRQIPTAPSIAKNGICTYDEIDFFFVR